jgi:hypothetical protein
MKLRTLIQSQNKKYFEFLTHLILMISKILNKLLRELLIFIFKFWFLRMWKRMDNPWELREALTMEHKSYFIHLILLISKYLNKLWRQLLLFIYKFRMLGMWIQNLKLSGAELTQVCAWNISVLIPKKNVELNVQPIRYTTHFTWKLVDDW